MPETSAKENAVAEARALQKAAIEGRMAAEEAVDPVVVGYDETQPGQTEIVAGSPGHEALLNSYPNATSYAPDVNVVLPPEVEEGDGEAATEAPVVVDVPFITQSGDTVSCTMGNWVGEPTGYTYAWVVDGEQVESSDDADYIVAAPDVGKSIVCVVTATNAIGSTEAPASNELVMEAY